MLLSSTQELPDENCFHPHFFIAQVKFRPTDTHCKNLIAGFDSYHDNILINAHKASLWPQMGQICSNCKNWGHFSFLGHVIFSLTNQSLHSWCWACSLCVNCGFCSEWSSSCMVRMGASCWQRHVLRVLCQILQLHSHKREMSSAAISNRGQAYIPPLLVFILLCQISAKVISSNVTSCSRLIYWNYD